MKTYELFGVTPEVAKAMEETMITRDYRLVGISLMNRVQKIEAEIDYNSKSYKYRAKAIANYEKWTK